MKLSVPTYAVGPIAHELHSEGVDSLLLVRTGPGWVMEFMAKIEPELLKLLTRLGAAVLP